MISKSLKVEKTVDLNRGPWHGFKGKGVLKVKCRSTRPTHAVLLVGFGKTKKNEEYFIVKNSWNTNWGDRGYVKLSAEQGFDSCLSSIVYLEL